MARRTELFALAVIVAGLALGALARLPQADSASPVAARVHGRARERLPGSAAALQALRDARPLDVNTAGVGDLELLPGVGPALAQRIVAHRVQHGAFATIDALAQVRGIGPKTLARLRPLIAITRPTRVPIDRTPAPATR